MPQDIPRYRLTRPYGGLVRGQIVSPYGRLEREMMAAGLLEPVDEPKPATSAVRKRAAQRKRRTNRKK